MRKKTERFMLAVLFMVFVFSCTLQVNAQKTIELSPYFKLSMNQAMKKLGGMDQINEGIGGCNANKGKTQAYRDGKWVTVYEIGIWCPAGKRDKPGRWHVEGIYSKKYSIYGLKVGMKFSKCKKKLEKMGYKYDKKSSFTVSGTQFRYYRKGKKQMMLRIENKKCSSISFVPVVGKS